MRFQIKSFLVALLMLSGAAQAAPTGLSIDVTKGVSEPMPIAIHDLSSADGSSSDLGRNIMSVVSADLERSGLFRPIDHSAFIEKISSGNQVPKFTAWRQINAQALVSGTIADSGGNKVKVGFRLWDVYGESQVAGKEFNTLKSNWRRVAHLLADEVYKRITGEEGYFDSRIVYVSESGPLKRRVKRLAIMDQDGENHKYLTDGKSLVLTPRFSPNSQEILYMSYASNKGPRVYLRDLQSGQEESLGRFDGMSFAPRFSNDGSKAVMSIAKGGSTQIFAMDLRSRQLHQLTNTPGAINTSPSYSPDGSKIVFNSDRGGSQQLYVMDAGGGNVQRISFGDGRYGTPVWSPRGDLIAFTKMQGGQFYIGVMHTDGNGERTLSHSFLDEGPTWSPNGRVIMFFRQNESSRSGSGGRSRLYSVDLTGNNLREVVTPGDASDPAWSPRLPM